MKYYPVGSVVDFRGTRLQVQEQKWNAPLCNGCYFSRASQLKRHEHISCHLHGIACTPFLRKDKKNIILKKQ